MVQDLSFPFFACWDRMFLQRIEQPQSSCSDIWGREKVKSSLSYPCACNDLCGELGESFLQVVSPQVLEGSASGRGWKRGLLWWGEKPQHDKQHLWKCLVQRNAWQLRHISTASSAPGCSLGEKAAGFLAIIVSSLCNLELNHCTGPKLPYHTPKLLSLKQKSLSQKRGIM